MASKRGKGYHGVMSESTNYQRTRALVHRLMNDPTFIGKIVFDRIIFVLILASVSLLVVEFMAGPKGEIPGWIWTFDHAILGIFTVEYLLRLWVVTPELPRTVVVSRKDWFYYNVAARVTWAMQPMNLVDLLAILPIFPYLRSLRILRILRLFTHIKFTQKLFRYFDPFAAASQTLRTNQLLYLFVLAFVFLVVLLGAGLAYIAEHHTNASFGTPFDAIWWAAVTVTTVGYGDMYPTTVAGRLIGMAVMASGFFLFALLAGVVSQTFAQSLLRIREEGIRMTAMVNHIIICGWNRHSTMLLHELRQQDPEIALRVVVFADRDPPVNLPEWATFVKGDPTQEIELPKVRLAVADSVIVVADEVEGGTFSDADARTLLTVFTLRAYEAKLNARYIERTQPLHIAAELLDPDNMPFLKKAGADEIIQTARFGSTLLAKSAILPNSGELFGDLVGSEGGRLQESEAPPEIQLPKPFWDVAAELKRFDGDLLVGIERQGRLIFNPHSSYIVEPGDKLVFLEGPSELARSSATQEGGSFWGPIQERH